MKKLKNNKSSKIVICLIIISSIILFGYFFSKIKNEEKVLEDRMKKNAENELLLNDCLVKARSTYLNSGEEITSLKYATLYDQAMVKIGECYKKYPVFLKVIKL